MKNIKTCEICESGTHVQFNKTINKYLCSKHRHHIERYGEIRDRTTKDRNIIIILEDHAEIILEDRQCKEKARAKISLDKVDKAKDYKWRLSNTGYATTNIDKKNFRLHNLIMDTPEGFIVDHISRDKLDCKNDNLRICKSKENSRNLSLAINNNSGITGVNWYESRDKWVAQIMVDRKHITLGYFTKIDDAIKVRKEAEIKYFGEFAPK